MPPRSIAPGHPPGIRPNSAAFVNMDSRAASVKDWDALEFSVGTTADVVRVRRVFLHRRSRGVVVSRDSGATHGPRIGRVTAREHGRNHRGSVMERFESVLPRIGWIVLVIVRDFVVVTTLVTALSVLVGG